MNEPILHVDMTPDGGLPLRVLRAYRANSDDIFATNDAGRAKQRARADLFDGAIATLERADKFRQAARLSGKPRGRPVQMARLLPALKRLLRRGHTGSEIHRRLARNCNPAPSQAWIYQQIGKLKNKTNT